MNTRHGAVLALLSATLFAASTPASKWLLQELPPLQLAGLLYLGAALATAPAVLRERRSSTQVRSMPWASAQRLLGAVALGGLVGPVLLLIGLRQSSAGSVALLLNLEGVATAVLGVWLFREPLSRTGWLGIAGATLAGALISSRDGWPGLAAAAWVLGACVCWGLDNHSTALIDGITPARSTFWKGLVAGATNLALGCASAPLTAEAPALAGAPLVGALSYGVSITLYIRSAQQLGATRAQAFFSTAPFIGAALAFAFLREPLRWEHAVGGTLLGAAVTALFWSRHEHTHVHAAGAHIHSHRHDDGHHTHTHPGLPASTRHSHWHRHERLVHRHPHWPDLHHRHSHRPDPDLRQSRSP